MRTIIALLCMIALSVTAFAGDSNVVLTVTNVTTQGNSRQAVVDVRIPDGVSVSEEVTLLALVGTDRKEVRPDEFGPPQNFALRGTSHQITLKHFRVTVSLPKETVTVRFLLRDGKATLLDRKNEI